jgi:hypothetical protein
MDTHATDDTDSAGNFTGVMTDLTNFKGEFQLQ